MAEAIGVTGEELGLFTDLYQLTMAQSYFHHRCHQPATFSLFIRKYPRHYTYFVAAGLATVVEYLQTVHFAPSVLAYLRDTGSFRDDFLTYLATWRFQGDVVALPEGCVFFVNEPVLEVTAPIIDAQLVESFLVNAVHMQTLIATKAARCVQAARGRSLVDFALRRTHGTDAAMKVARASYLVGFEATSNVLAGQVYGIPITGTMAHSYVACFPEEIDAFRAFAATYPTQTVLLIDTYDTRLGAKRAAVVGQEMARQGQRLLGVRLDSGDMTGLSQEVRAILDAAGLPEVRIVASGGFDEYAIDEALQQGACIDIFGVGTKMGVAADAPYFDMAYKLAMYDGRPVMKLSADKATLVGDKQVWRCTRDGVYVEDIIALRRETLELKGAQPLLQPVMRAGRLVGALPGLDEARAQHRENMARLPDAYRGLAGGEPYPVRRSQALAMLQGQVEAALRQRIVNERNPKHEGRIVMDLKTQETYRQRLLDMQEQIVKRIFELEENLQRLTAEREIERTDRVQAEVPEAVLQRLDEQGRREVDDIQAALRRIEAGTYGYCETCGGTIPLARLDILPLARRCIRCQEHQEHMARG